jgi:FkbM family methyltransferase
MTTTKFWSQCGEDKFLSEYFAENKIKPTKVVVEVGAGRPEEISNSKYFIDQGWRACLIEPNYQCYRELVDYHANNPKVKVYQTLIGNEEGVTKLDITKRHWALGHETTMDNAQGQVVGKNTLKNILDNFGNKKIGVLSLDIEGGESAVLQHLMGTKYRPEFLLVEALNDESVVNIDNVISQEYDLIKILSLTRVYKLK